MVVGDVLIESNLSPSLSNFPITLYVSTAVVGDLGVGPEAVYSLIFA